jgi:hypothetical protein
VLGLPERAVEDITLEDVDLALDPNNTEAGQPAMASVCAQHCRAGILARYTRRLALRNVRVHNQLGPAVDVRDSTEFNETT